jgi:hypothetical protein
MSATENTENPGLAAKNVELLGELKAAKQRAKDLEAERETLRADLRTMRVDVPVSEMLTKVLIGSKFAAAELAESYKFDLDEEGKLVMLDTDGKPVECAVDPQSIRAFLAEQGTFDHIILGTQSSGGGAIGGSQGMPKRPAVVVKQASPYGLK